MIKLFRHHEISEVVGMCSEVHGDARGYFFENHREVDLKMLAMRSVQENTSMSHAGVVRGLHYQRLMPQAKLVEVLHGEIIDFFVDLRRGSRTFMKSGCLTLRVGDRVFVPRGFAHGFIALKDCTIVNYKNDAPYDAFDQNSINPMSVFRSVIESHSDGKFLLSPKDAKAPALSDLTDEWFFQYGEVVQDLVPGLGVMTAREKQSHPTAILAASFKQGE